MTHNPGVFKIRYIVLSPCCEGLFFIAVNHHFENKHGFEKRLTKEGIASFGGGGSWRERVILLKPRFLMEPFCCFCCFEVLETMISCLGLEKPTKGERTLDVINRNEERGLTEGWGGGLRVHVWVNKNDWNTTSHWRQTKKEWPQGTICDERIKT